MLKFNILAAQVKEIKIFFYLHRLHQSTQNIFQNDNLPSKATEMPQYEKGVKKHV